MDPRLTDQRRYLAAVEAAVASAPELHRNQRVAVARERAIAAAAADPAACRRASGDLFELARAAWLDRQVAHARIAAALDDPWTTQAMAVEVEATLGATGHADWVAALQAGSIRAAPWQHRAAEARSAMTTLATALVTAAWDLRPGPQAETRASADAAWQRWCAVEPMLAQRGVAATLASPRYRARVPWTGDGWRAFVALHRDYPAPADVIADQAPPPCDASLDAIERRLAAWRAGLAHATPGPVVGGEPEVADVIAPYLSLAALTGDHPAVRALARAARGLVDDARGAATPQAVLAAWTERDRLADLAAASSRADAALTLERAALWPDPLRAAGARALLADLSGVRTGTEVDLLSMHHGACGAIEASWSYALGAGLLAPLDATAIAGWDPDAAGSIAPAWTVAHALAGAGAGLLALPRVEAVLALIATRDARGHDLGAFAGELGHGTVGEAAAWLGVRGLAARTAPAVAAAFTAAWGTPPADVARPVRLWDRELALDALTTPPPRPPAPGRSPRSAS